MKEVARLAAVVITLMLRKLSKAILGLIQTSYLYIATLLNVSLVALGVWLHSVSAWDHPKTFIAIVALLLLTGFLDIYLKVLHDRGNAYAVHQEFINDLLEKFINGLLEVAAVSMLRAVNPQTDSIRVNVMLPDEANQHLSISYAYGFSNSDMDRFINIPINTGCAGQAWLHCLPVVADATQLFTVKPAHWGLPTKEIEKIRISLQSIFSIPIQLNNRCLAILNFDSDNSLDEMKFDDPKVQLIGFSFASIIAVALRESL